MSWSRFCLIYSVFVPLPFHIVCQVSPSSVRWRRYIQKEGNPRQTRCATQKKNKRQTRHADQVEAVQEMKKKTHLIIGCSLEISLTDGAGARIISNRDRTIHTQMKCEGRSHSYGCRRQLEEGGVDRKPLRNNAIYIIIQSNDWDQCPTSRKEEGETINVGKRRTRIHIIHIRGGGEKWGISARISMICWI